MGDLGDTSSRRDRERALRLKWLELSERKPDRAESIIMAVLRGEFSRPESEVST